MSDNYQPPERIVLEMCQKCGLISRHENHTTEVCQQRQIDELKTRLVQLAEIVDLTRGLRDVPINSFDPYLNERLARLGAIVQGWMI